MYLVCNVVQRSRVTDTPELTGKVRALEMLFLGSGFIASVSEGGVSPDLAY